MRRSLITVFWSLIAAGALGAVLTVVLWNEGGPISLPTPVPTATRTPVRTVVPTPSVPPTASPTPAPSPTDRPTPLPIVAAKTINCNRAPTFCSQTSGSMAVRGEKLVERRATSYPISYAGVPKTTMTWRILRPDGTDAHAGDTVRKLVVRVSVYNGTDHTFVFPRREIAIDVARNNKTFHEVATNGESFRMTPGGRLNATFDIPIAYDGDYRWRAKTWFYRAD